MTPRFGQTLPAELQNPIKIVLDSGNFGTYYQLIVWINVTLTPARHVPVIYANPVARLTGGLSQIAIEKLKAKKMKKLRVAGEGALAVGNLEKLHVLVPAAGATIWAQTRDITSKRQPANNQWSKLAEGITAPIAVLTEEDGTMDLVGRGHNGHAWHTRWDDTASGAPKAKWHDLGHAMNEEIALVRDGKALDIFMLNDEGAVMHAHIAGEAKSPTWKSLGGKISTELDAVSLSDGEIALFGLGKEGDVFHKMHSSNGKSAWTSFGSSANVQLSVLSDDKHGVVLFAITKNRSVSRKSWNGKTWSPSTDEWTELGNVDSLFAQRRRITGARSNPS